MLNGNTKKLLAFALSSTLSLGVYAQSWKAEAINDLNNGNFAKVERTLNTLSKKEKRRHAVLVDSLQAMMQRIRYDFQLTPEEGKKQLLEKVPNATDAMIAEWKAKKYLETRIIDGQEWWFRKTIRNFTLLNKELFGSKIILNKRKDYAAVQKTCQEILAQKTDANNTCDWKFVEGSFYLEVPANAVPNGEKIRAWFPFPYDNGRQRNFKLISSPSDAVHSSEGCIHHTIYMEQIAKKDKPTRFEMKFSYEVGAQVFHKGDILRNLQPYDINSADYKKYTCQELPHMLVNDKMKDLAHKIVGKETNPVKQASLIYDWISGNYPWAGAIDYSTIPCIPEYVLNIDHGDCGQVSLLYISLLRSLGIPARWESGWEFTADWSGYHDWLEIYFEGTGWVPCDISRGRTTYNEAYQDFYKTCIDGYRFATNQGIGGELSPKKKYIRCETVDFQAGEVEWAKGNLTKWSSDLKIEKITPIK